PLVDGDLGRLDLAPPGEGERKTTSDAEAALTPDLSAVGFDEATTHIEADPGPAVGACGRAVELEEALEEPGYVAREDARAFVDDGDLELVALLRDLDDHVAVGVFEGVVDEMVQDLLDLGGVDREGEVLPRSLHLHPLLDGGVHEGTEIDVLEMHLRPPRLDGRHEQDVLDLALEALGVGLDGLQGQLPHVRIEGLAPVHERPEV